MKKDLYTNIKDKDALEKNFLNASLTAVSIARVFNVPQLAMPNTLNQSNPLRRKLI
tara:strand:- start:630 stop:797 length:168 start_codon:yes stop_codon:yes gene_type:complete